jgi:DNA-binding PadR family transcriptional regulator
VISSDIMRGYNDIIVLALLYELDSYGYEISKAIQERSGGNYIIKETTLYSTINRLEKNGYIASYFGSESFGKQRTYYTITNAGRAYYLDKCKEWELTKLVINEFTKGEVANG